jgi:signal peptidase I
MSSTVDSGQSTSSVVWENVRTILYALAIAFLVRFWVAQPFRIPSSSMEPTLLVGDYIVVTKWSYGYSRFSFAPLEQLLPEGRFLGSLPERGDIAVFRPPNQPDKDFVKRIVGLPGDVIRVVDGEVFIQEGGQGEFLPVTRAVRPEIQTPFGEMGPITAYEETLPNGVHYITYDNGPGRDLDNGEWRVPEGHYFMMGDNRDNSQDSRAPCPHTPGYGDIPPGPCLGPVPVGFVPEDHLVGPAQFVFVSFNQRTSLAPWTWVTGFRANRFMRPVE